MSKLTISMGMALVLGISGATAVLTGCSTEGRSTGQYVDDKALAYNVSSALHRNPQYKFNTVDVKVYRANVQLSGFVPSQDQKNEAGQIASHVPGVQGVENNLTVRPSMNQPG
jgi:hyperosmotically inducible periplasmic protein